MSTGESHVHFDPDVPEGSRFNDPVAQADGDDGLQDAVTESFKTAEPFLEADAGMQQEAILRYFAYEHLPPSLQSVSKPFAELANDVIMGQPRCAERTVALRKLLESKDATVRAALPAGGYPLARDGVLQPPSETK